VAEGAVSGEPVSSDFPNQQGKHIEPLREEPARVIWSDCPTTVPVAHAAGFRHRAPLFRRVDRDAARRVGIGSDHRSHDLGQRIAINTGLEYVLAPLAIENRDVPAE